MYRKSRRKNKGKRQERFLIPGREINLRNCSPEYPSDNFPPFSPILRNNLRLDVRPLLVPVIKTFIIMDTGISQGISTGNGGPSFLPPPLSPRFPAHRLYAEPRRIFIFKRKMLYGGRFALVQTRLYTCYLRRAASNDVTRVRTLASLKP